MEFRWGRGNGWFLVAVCADDDEDKKEAFSLEIACELIAETPQKDGIQVVCVCYVNPTSRGQRSLATPA